MSASTHFERIATVGAVGYDLSLLDVVEQLVLDAAVSAGWRGLDELERSVEIHGQEGSIKTSTVEEGRRELERSGIKPDRVNLMLRERLSYAPLVRAVRVDAHPDRTGAAHVWGPDLGEVLGLVQQIENVAGKNRPPQGSRVPRAEVDHVWGPGPGEVLGLVQRIENVDGRNRPPQEGRVTRDSRQASTRGGTRSFVKWWRDQGISGQVTAAVIAGVIVLIVAALLR